MFNFIVNPNALRGKQDKFIRYAEKRLQEAGAEYRFFFSEKQGCIGKYARSLTAAGQTKIIAVGGDGTLNEVLCNLTDPENTVLGLVPAGTGNDFAEAAKIPKGIRALDLILNTEPQYTDYIECGNGVRSMNIAGMGIDVDILERCARKKRGGSRRKYFFSLLASLAHYRGLDLEVTADGETKRYNALVAAVCNGSLLGGGIPLCPPAVIDDGKLDLLVADCPRRSQIPFALIKLMCGKVLKLPIAHHILCEEVHIVPAAAQTVQCDGELFPMEELRAKIVSGKLRMFRG